MSLKTHMSSTHKRVKLSIVTALVSDGLGKLLPLLTMAYGSRVLSPNVFGETQFSLYFLEYFVPAIVWGYSFQTINKLKEFSSDKEKARSYIAKILGLRLLHATFCALIMVFIVFSYDEYHIYQTYLICLAPMLILSSFGSDFYLISSQKLTFFHMILVVSKLSIFALVVLFVESKDDALTFTLLTFAVNLVSAILTYLLMCRDLGFIKPKLARSFEVFKASIPYGLFTFFYMIPGQLDVLVVEWLGGEEAVGIYSPAMRLYLSLYASIVAVGAVFYSESVADKVSEKAMEKLLSQGFLTLFVIALPVAAGSFFLGDRFFEDLFGKGYGKSAALFSTLSIGLLGQSIVHTLVFQILLPKQKIKQLTSIFISFFLLTALFAVVGAYLGEVGGVALGMSLVRLLQGAILLFLCRRFLTRLPVKEFFRVAIPCLFMAAGLFWLQGEWHWSLTIALGVFLFVLSFFLVNRHLFTQLVSMVKPQK